MEDLGAQQTEISRRSFLRGMGVGAAGAIGLGMLVSSEAQTLPADGSVFSNEEGEQPQPAAFEQPAAPTEPKTPEERAEELNKLKAETRKINADAAQTEANTRSTDAQTEKTERETEEIGTFGYYFEKRAALVGTLLTAITGILTVGVTHRKNKRDSFDAREKDRQDRKAKEREQTDTRFNEMVERLLTSQQSDPAKDESLGASVELRVFTAPEYRRFHRRIFDLSVGLLRSRETVKDEISKRVYPPSPFDQNILRAFLTVTGPLREQELQNREAHSVRDRFRAAGKWIVDKVTRTTPEEPVPVLDASAINLDGMSLSGEDLSYLDLSDASMDSAMLSGAIFRHSDLREVDLRRARLKGAVIDRSNVYGIKLRESNVKGSYWNEIDFTGVTILAPQYMKGARIIGTKGLAAEDIPKLKKRGVSVKEKTDYGAPVPEIVPGNAPAIEQEILADAI